MEANTENQNAEVRLSMFAGYDSRELAAGLLLQFVFWAAVPHAATVQMPPSPKFAYKGHQ